MHHQIVLWFEPFKMVVLPFCMALWALSNVPLQSAASKRTLFYIFLALLEIEVLSDLEWVVSACARCQSHPSNTNCALTAPTQTPKPFVAKKRRSAGLMLWVDSHEVVDPKIVVPFI